MAEIKDAPPVVAPTEDKTPGKIVSRGPVTPASVTAPKPAEADAGAGEAETLEAKATREAAELAAKNQPPEVTDEQLKELLKGKGIELDDKGFDGLKEKMKPVPAAAAEPTAEEKLAAEAAFEKRMADFYVSQGGTLESFVAFKQVAAMDLKSLSESEIRRELKEANFTDDEIKAVMVERYYQINPAELVRDEEKETEEEFTKRKADTEKKIAYGSKKMETKGSYTKKTAESALSTLREAVKLQDLQAEEEVKHSTGVKEFFTKLPRKVTFQLGKTEDGLEELPPVEYEIKDEHIADVQSVLMDPAKRKQFLYNEDNSLNLSNVASVMLKNKYLEDALKATYIDAEKRGSKKQVEIFEKTFPGRTAKDIGVGGATGSNGQGRKGHIVSRGAAEPVRR